ncbi:hypothetical protein LCGC14_1895970 [marine sediment metagenome]|uniref:Uncharacterized protein n=2 Tax=root TaxID=1 RepID=A0A0F9FY35_9ZZZZ|nr:MAG: hypothetical protein LCMAC202_00450 [Marseillevirus LCMAC202]
MSGTNFSISATESDFCFQPLTCATSKGHLVVWGTGIDANQSVWVRSFIGRKASCAIKISTINEKDNIIFFRRFHRELCVLAIETNDGYKLYFLNDNGDVCDSQIYTTKDILVHCYQNNQDTIIFVYNHDNNTMSVQTVFVDKSWDNAQTTHHYDNVYGIPHVFIFEDDNYTAGWITCDDKLTVVSNCVYSKDIATETIVASYDIDYLIAACLCPDLVVYGGYYTRNKVLRLDYFRVSDLKLVCSRYWKSDEYKDMSFSMASLNRGFMLLADGPSPTQACGQRFTHLGSWLYPMMSFDSSDIPTWSPDLAQGNEETLLVYIKYHEDYSEVWGKWLDIGIIPELENLTLADVEAQ